MKNDDFFDYSKKVNDLATILSIAHFYRYYFKVIEERIVKSEYFSSYTISDNYLSSVPYTHLDKTISAIFYDTKVDLSKNIYFDEFEWIATMYLFILDNASINFETLFLYIPIEEALSMYKLYHELDLNKSLKYFNEKREKNSVIKLAMKELDVSNGEISSSTSISYSMIDALKNRRRDIKKLNVEQAFKLSKALMISIETLLNN